MSRTLLVVGALAVVALALLIVACGSDPAPTSAPAATVASGVAPDGYCCPAANGASGDCGSHAGPDSGCARDYGGACEGNADADCSPRGAGGN